MKEIINIREVSRNLFRYVDAVQEGAEFVITRRGVPVAKLVGIQKSRELTEAQLQALKRTRDRMRKGYSLGGHVPRRNGMHEREGIT